MIKLELRMCYNCIKKYEIIYFVKILSTKLVNIKIDYLEMERLQWNMR
jgi:hypothetical protein